MDKDNQIRRQKEPLASRMAPENIDELIGQEHILSKGKLLRRMIEADRLTSIILFGPPGTGKTSIAKVIAKTTNNRYEKLNAVTSGVADIKRIIAETQNKIFNPSGRTVLFIDEIHRFNKAQQDALLPYVEDGTLILIGATTQNPYFEVNKAIISRSTVFPLYPLTEDSIVLILKNAISDISKGLGESDISVEDKVLDYIADISNGDARIALNALELAAMTSPADSEGKIVITGELIQECIQKRSISFDADGESHYDTISAFIKSMRGSDPDAAVFYLARALHGGEDIEFLARRIIICASEDVGMANPSALNTAVMAYNAIMSIGMPEARIILAQAAIAVAVSPKSNACYLAIDNALKDVREKRTGEIPMHLRNAPVKEMRELGYSKGYKYVHDFPGNYIIENYLPEEISRTTYYNPYSNGYEEKIKEWLEKKRNIRDKKNMESDKKPDEKK